MINIAIIPARIGSKRIHKKNIKPFFNKPIIAYSIECAIESKVFDEIIVSTDSKEIAEIAQEYGATVPFFRSKKNSDDFATLFDVVKEVLENEMYCNEKIDIVACILPTTPLLDSVHLQRSVKCIKKEPFDSVFSVTEYDYPVQRALFKYKDNIKFIFDENSKKRTQDFKECFHDAGQFYIAKHNVLIASDRISCGRRKAYKLSNFEAQDIDTFEDWAMAELKYLYIKKMNAK